MNYNIKIAAMNRSITTYINFTIQLRLMLTLRLPIEHNEIMTASKLDDSIRSMMYWINWKLGFIASIGPLHSVQ